MLLFSFVVDSEGSLIYEASCWWTNINNWARCFLRDKCENLLSGIPDAGDAITSRPIVIPKLPRLDGFLDQWDNLIEPINICPPGIKFKGCLRKDITNK